MRHFLDSGMPPKKRPREEALKHGDRKPETLWAADAPILLPYLSQRCGLPGAAQPGTGGNRDRALHLDRPEGGGGTPDRLPGQPHGEISLQRVPGEAPRFQFVIHIH